MELIYKIECLNIRCNNFVDDYRAERQGQNITKMFFCSHCTRARIGGAIEFYCRKENCNNTLKFNGTSAAFCSRLCASRYHYNTRENELRQCKNCDKMYESNLGRVQYFCSVECRTTNGKRQTTFISCQNLILQLLQRGDNSIENISRYTKKSHGTIRTSIIKLRLKGLHIVKLESGLYHFEGKIE